MFNFITQFYENDIVQLISGGPLMTVTGFEKDSVICSWFTVQGENRIGNFRPGMLRILKELTYKDRTNPLNSVRGTNGDFGPRQLRIDENWFVWTLSVDDPPFGVCLGHIPKPKNPVSSNTEP